MFCAGADILCPMSFESKNYRGRWDAYGFFAMEGDSGGNLALAVLVGDTLCQPFLQLKPERSPDPKLRRDAQTLDTTAIDA